MPPRAPSFLRGLCVGLFLAFIPFLQGAPEKFDLPAQPAGAALLSYSIQAGSEVLFASDQVAGVRTNAVTGFYEPAEAMMRLLADTGLSAARSATGKWIVTASAPRTPAASPPQPLATTTDSRVASISDQITQTKVGSMKNKPRTPIPLISAWLALMFSAASSTGAPAPTGSPAPGSLAGTVSNVATGKVLEGARVFLPSINVNAQTNNVGRYTIESLPPGTYDVVASYIGLDSVKMEVVIEPGAQSIRNFDLTSEIYKLEAFRVAGEREGNALAITMQRNAPNEKNVVAMDSFGNLPNLNAGELAIRLPGVASSLNDEGLVNGFTIRGMPPGLNVVTVDGSALTNQFAMSRSASVHTFTGAMFEQLELTKGHRPDEGANSLGGTINLKTRSPLSMREKRRINYNFSTKVAPSFTQQMPLREKHRAHPLLNVSYEEVFGVGSGDRNLGVAVNAFYSENASGVFRVTRDFQNTASDPAFVYDYTVQNNYNNRKQASVSAKVDYRLAPATKLSLNTLYNDANEPSNLRFNTRFFTNQTVGTTGTAGILPGYTDRITQTRAVAASTINTTGAVTTFMNRMRLAGLEIEHKRGALQFDAATVYNRTFTSNGNEKNVSLVNQLTNVGWILDRSGSDLHPRVTQAGGADFLNPANYRPSNNGLTNANNQSKNAITEGRANLQLTLPTAAPLLLKGGVQWRENVVREISAARRWAYRGIAPLPADPSLVMWESIKSNVAIPQWTPSMFLHDRNPIAPELWSEDLYFYETNKYTGTRTAKEAISAGYAMLQGNVSHLGALSRTKFLTGIRGEKTDSEGSGWVRARRASTPAQQQADPIGSALRDYADTRRELSSSYTKWFPSAHLSHDITNNLKARMSWSTSFGRPAMSNLLPNESANDGNQTLTVNNPGLLPQTASNWDTSIEYYFEPVGSFELGWFHKTIKDYIVTGVEAGRVRDGIDNGYGGEYGGYTLLSSANAGEAVVQGWEISYQQQLTFLPGLLRGLAVNANYTLIDAHGDFGGNTRRTGSDVPGFVPRAANVSLSWRYGAFSMLALYNRTGSYLMTYAAAGPVRYLYRSERQVVNLGLVYRIRPAVSLTCDISNLFNEPQVFYRGFRDRMQSTIVTGTTITCGVRGQF